MWENIFIMNNVTSQNFKEIYPHLERTLKDASFIAIDTELSGIKSDNIKNRLVFVPLSMYE